MSNQVYTTKDFYVNLKGQIEEYLPEMKGKVFLFNNQFQHSNGDKTAGRDESAFQYPVVFLEFNNFKYKQLGLGVQEFYYDLTTHFGYKSLLKEDLKVYDLLEKLFWTVERFQAGSFNRITRIGETWDTNHDNAQIIKSVYEGYSKDYNRFVFGNQTFLNITGITQTDIIVSATTQTNNLSGTTDSNGNNQYVAPIIIKNIW